MYIAQDFYLFICPAEIKFKLKHAVFKYILFHICNDNIDIWSKYMLYDNILNTIYYCRKFAKLRIQVDKMIQC